LIPEGSFTHLLEDLRHSPEAVAPTLQSPWDTMDKGGFSPVLRKDLLRFSGGLGRSNVKLLPFSRTTC